MNKSNIIITIDRQSGSGGKEIGERLNEKLKFSYYDDEIVREAAKDLQTSVEEIEPYDEKQDGIWKNILSYSEHGNLSSFSDVEIITDDKAHKAESNIIIKIANEKPAVIIGRAASYILRNHPRHVSIFLHADVDYRKKRTRESNNISGDEAEHLNEKIDKQRLKYYKVFTGTDMYNACGYDLSIDTSKLGIEKSEILIMEYLKERFGDELLKAK
ncbi:cytidylate kinase-like family protein [Clostridium estertheticum]|uniref:cytidylate kinase-like family protein n=1 Tax=Clostridium estertheticum TaxID=238834 RepID=UPI001C0B2B24|nr:cytidylate kinase-like family protein [Clostridium estertheticum]MBU3217887.1 cytidylate kinase-like family protein [Clostridium estertheticum]WAG55710.1 cytidylate kinase-like family protein [Clostridium estertheticum]